MLQELRNVRQIPGEPRRRWFFSHELDLIVWLDAQDGLAGFQLCYDKYRRERAFTWREGRGFCHLAVDDGESSGVAKEVPLLEPDGSFEPGAVLAQFLAQAAAVPEEVVSFIAAKLREYRQPEERAMLQFEYRIREPLSAPEDSGGCAPQYRRSVEAGMIVERDLAVAMRDGTRIYVDLFRPADERPAPALVAWGPYGKHSPTNYARQFPASGVDQSKLSAYTGFEAPDPLYWVSRGYAVINPDPRGTWFSEGTATFLSPEEGQDEYDLIEWAGTQPWSSGKVGLAGVSYLASSQYHVAALNPPHLAAINPWEGWSDFYREVARHGGIPETEFWGYLPSRWGRSKTRIEDLRLETEEHPLYDAFWASKVADFSRIAVPAYVVASWTDQGLHTRGTLEVYKKISSQQKWLEVHGRKKWAYYYEQDSVKRQLAFFERFLKGVPNEVDTWPKVRLEVREKYYVGTTRIENEWPIARTQYTRLYLDPGRSALEREPVAAESSCRYAPGKGRASFDYRFERRTDLVGHMKLKLWMAPQGADDMDIFIAIQKLDAVGAVVPFPFFAQFEDGPVALGWLRASHRELDAQRSTEYQPVLQHRRELKLKPGEAVPLEIEIWPSGTRFEAGEGLRLVVQGTDIYPHPRPCVQDLHEDTVNRGEHVILGGARYDSHLLVPVVPD
jgi:predicted acyl esterase